MGAELVRALGLSALACSAAIVVVLMLRRPLRTCFGARIVYALWLLVPLVTAAAWLPPRVVVTFVPVAAVHTAQPVAARPAAPASNPDATRWIALLWATGAIAAVLVAWRQQRRFVRQLGVLSQIGPQLWRAQGTTGCPALVGALRPRVVVPRDFEQRYDAAQRALVLAHERLHRKRGDAQINALIALASCVYWFNPLVYFAASRLRFDQELACDAMVVARAPPPRPP
jgi:bla regulator protein BlaR1